MRTFVDTNVLAYLYDTAGVAKQHAALTAFAALEPGDIVIGAQVMAEFASVAARLAEPLSDDAIDAALASLAQLTTVPVTAAIVLRARELRRAASLSHWDAQIVAAAEEAGCGEILTEDLATGSVIEGITIRSPFA